MNKQLHSNLKYTVHKYIWLLLCVLLVIPSCNITKFLDEDQSYIEEVRLTIINGELADNKTSLKEELEKFYRIYPTNKSKNYFYYKYKDLEDPGWIKRWLKNKRSEPPNLFDQAAIDKTAADIQSYLRNKKGYYQAEVISDAFINKTKRKAYVYFNVWTDRRYTVHSIKHLTQDSSLSRIVNSISKESLIKVGDPIDALNFDLEKQRIISEFQRMGYADFNLTNVEINGDSTLLDKQWDIFFTILAPSNAKQHTVYTIGDINVYTDYHKFQKEEQLTEENLFNKSYKRQSSDYIVRPSTIDRKIYLRKYDDYNLDNYYKTVRSLFSLGAYRFAKVSPIVSAKDSSIIDYNILLTPHNKKWILDFGLDAFFSNISRINNDLIGLGFGAGIQDRNTFGGSEKFQSTIEAGVEFNPSGLSVNSQSFGFNNVLQIPALTKPFNIVFPLHKLGVISKKAFQKLNSEGQSTFELGFNYLDILNYYELFSIKASYGFDVTLNKRNRVSFNQIGVNYAEYNIPVNGLFFPIVQRDPVLSNSFQTSLFTGFLFKELSYYYQKESPRNISWALISRMELSGLEVFGVNQLSNLISGKSDIWKLQNGTEFEKMVKLQFDARWYKGLSESSQLAARIKTGVAIPIAEDQSVSYIKQFFVGGPSSIRAWRPMHIGPGGHADSITHFPKNNSIFYQRGDIVLEFSMEYRFDLIWYLQGALFLDGGNIWTIRDDPNRPGALISRDFLNQMALGYGYGFRFDFNYFIIRFDLGFKLRYASPFPNTNRHWVSPKGQKFGNFNIAVNYPF